MFRDVLIVFETLEDTRTNYRNLLFRSYSDSHCDICRLKNEKICILRKSFEVSLDFSYTFSHMVPKWCEFHKRCTITRERLIMWLLPYDLLGRESGWRFTARRPSMKFENSFRILSFSVLWHAWEFWFTWKIDNWRCISAKYQLAMLRKMEFWTPFHVSWKCENLNFKHLSGPPGYDFHIFQRAAAQQKILNLLGT